MRIKNRQGRELIDCGAGLWCVNIGYGRAGDRPRRRGRRSRISRYYHIFGSASNEPIIRLADRVLGAVPREGRRGAPLARCSSAPRARTPTTPTSSWSATTTICAAEPQKKKIISRLGGYHGLTYAAGSLTGIAAYHKAFDLPCRASLHTACPHYYRYAEQGESEDAFTDRMVAELEALIAARGPGDGRRLHRRADHGHRRRAAAAERLLRAGCRRCSTSTTSCSSPTRSSPASAAPAHGSPPASTTSSPTS